MRKELLLSTAAGMGLPTVLSFYLPGIRGERAASDMVDFSHSRGFKPEIMLSCPLMQRQILEQIKLKTRDKIAQGDTVYWHLPKFAGYNFSTDSTILAERFARGNPVGVLFYTPARFALNPYSEKEYIKELDVWSEVFPPVEAAKHVLTIHDYTMIKRKADGNLSLKPVGEKLRMMAEKGYKVSIELSAEGSFPILSVPAPGYLDQFMAFCQKNNFGLTLDTFNFWRMTVLAGGTMEDYFPNFARVINEARKHKVPINLVHFKTFDDATGEDGVAPKDATFSYQFLRDFLDFFGLGDVPITLEVKKRNMGNVTKETISAESSARQKTMEKILARHL